MPPVSADMLIHLKDCDVQIVRGNRRYGVVFTDGSIKLPRSQWLAHGGWGLFTGLRAQTADYGALGCVPFTSYRAELRGVIEACSRAVDPIAIVVDNMAVCDGLAMLIDQVDLGHGKPPCMPSDDPMWEAVLQLLQRLPRRHVRCQWVPSHLLDDAHNAKLDAYLAEGGDIRLLQGNLQADILADKGAALLPPRSDLIAKERLAAKLASVAQSMQIMVWAAYRGYTSSQQELDGVSAIVQAERGLADHTPEYDYSDPFLQEFLAQEDVGAQTCHVEHEDYDPWAEEEENVVEEGSSPLGVGGGHPSADICRESKPDEPVRNDQTLATLEADPAQGKAEEEGNKTPSVSSALREFHASIVSKARYFPFTIDEEVKSAWKCRLKNDLSLVDVLTTVNLGKAAMEVSGGRKIFTNCLLLWAEPMLWTLQNVRWTIPVQTQTSSMRKRQTSMSWEEMAIFLSIFTNRAIGPLSAPLLLCAAIAKQMCKRLARFLEAFDGEGNVLPFTRFLTTMPSAGAAVTCGLANLQGVNRRIITEDFPGTAIGTATLLRFVANSKDRLCTPIPAYPRFRTPWEPSGRITTVEQMRSQAQRNAGRPSRLKADFQQGRTPHGQTRQNSMKGPCLFGCTSSAMTSSSGMAWYRVPAPSPWPGVKTGEILCRKCYLWGIANRKAAAARGSRKRAQPAVSSSVRGLQIGTMVRIAGLMHATRFNGCHAEVHTAEDDSGKVVVRVHDEQIRLDVSRLYVIAGS